MQVTFRILAVTLLLAAQASAQETPRSRDYATIDHAVISLKHYAQLPALQAGVLKKLELEDGTPIEEGVEVTKDQLLGKLDDLDAAARRRAAQLEYEVAQGEHEKAGYSIKAADKTVLVAENEYLESKDVNKRAPGAVPEMQVARQKLTWERSQIESQVARKDEEGALRTANLRQAQVDVASINLDHHQIKSPLDGEIVQVYRKVGEWVGPGDAIMRIVDLKRLRVEGFLKIGDYLRQEVIGQPVTIEIRLPGRRVERFTSVITHASPLVQASGDYRVVCEVENRKSEGHWVLLPGMDASMQITLKKSRLAAAR